MKTNTSSNSYVKPPPNSNPFGDPNPYSNKPNSSNYQQHPTGKVNQSNPFEKGSNSKGLGGKLITPTKNEPMSNYKPNLNGRSTNSNNYW